LPTYQEAEAKARFLEREDLLEQYNPERKLKNPEMLLAAGFVTYNTAMKAELAKEEPQSIAKAVAVVAVAALGLRWLWLRHAVPPLAEAMRVRAPELAAADATSVAAAYADNVADRIDQTSADALIKGFEQELGNNTPPAVAWERAVAGFGLPERGLLGYLKNLAKSGYKRNDNHDKAITKGLLARAQMIGEEEAFAASQTGKSVQWLILRSTGDIPADSKKKWSTRNDEQVCPICRPLDGQVVELDERFHTEAGNLWAPGAHIGCRCEVHLDYSGDIGKAADYLESHRRAPEAMARSRAKQEQASDDFWRKQTRGSNGRWVDMNRAQPSAALARDDYISVPIPQPKIKPTPALAHLLQEVDTFSSGDSTKSLKLGSALDSVLGATTSAPSREMLSEVVKRQDTKSLQHSIALDRAIITQSAIDFAMIKEAEQRFKADQELLQQAAAVIREERKVEAPPAIQEPEAAPEVAAIAEANPEGYGVRFPVDQLLLIAAKAEAMGLTPSQVPELAHLPKSFDEISQGDLIDFDDLKVVLANVYAAQAEEHNAVARAMQSGEDVSDITDLLEYENSLRRSTGVQAINVQEAMEGAESDYLLRGMDLGGPGYSSYDVIELANQVKAEELERRGESMYEAEFNASFSAWDSEYFPDDETRQRKLEDMEDLRKELRSAMYLDLQNKIGGDVEGYVDQMDLDDIREIYDSADVPIPDGDLKERFADDIYQEMEINGLLFSSLDDFHYEANQDAFIARNTHFAPLDDYVGSPAARDLGASRAYVFTFPEGLNADSLETYHEGSHAAIKGQYRVGARSVETNYEDTAATVDKIIYIDLIPSKE
jgi:hypothetical protein